MSAPLRPMSTGEILDRTFNLYRNNFMLFAGIAVVPPALMLVVNLMQAGFMATPGRPVRGTAGLAAAGGAAAVVAIIAAIAYLVGIAVAHAATVFAVSAVHLDRKTSIGESYAKVKGHYGRVVWVIFQVGLRSFVPAFVVIVFAAVFLPLAVKGGGKAAGALVGMVAVLAIFAAVILGVILYLRFALAVPACVLEDIPAGDAIRRSVALSRGCRGQIFVIYLLMAVISYIILLLFMVPAGIMAATVAKGSPAAAGLFTSLASFLAGALAGPIATIALSLVYFDQRVRKEAFDLQLMMAAVDGMPLPAAQSATAG
jgi:hypothetical protein